MGFTCDTQEERRNTLKVSVGKSKEIEHMEDLYVDGNITSTMNLKRSIRQSTD
jgi:hypothetical protein